MDAPLTDRSTTEVPARWRAEAAARASAPASAGVPQQRHAPEQLTAPPAPAPPVPTPVRHRGTLLPMLSVVVGGALLVSQVVRWVGTWEPGWTVADAVQHTRIDIGGQVLLGSTGPQPGLEEADAPRGTPPALADTGAPYTFGQTQDGAQGTATPVAWSPCRPLHYVITRDDAPPGFAAQVDTVMAEISAATGLQVVSDGVTDEPASLDRSHHQPERYGDRWAPVLIGFADEQAVPSLAGAVAGLAAPVSLTRADLDYAVYVSGAVVLDTALLDEPKDAAGDPGYLRVLRHEVGHLVGLGHVDDPGQLMNPQIAPDVTTFQDGDRYGLAQLGQGTCAPDL